MLLRYNVNDYHREYLDWREAYNYCKATCDPIYAKYFCRVKEIESRLRCFPDTRYVILDEDDLSAVVSMRNMYNILYKKRNPMENDVS